MAKIFRFVRRSRGSFAAAEAMNRSVGDFDGWVRRGAVYRRQLRSLAEPISPDWAARLQPLEPGFSGLARISGRFSALGTTLLDTFLMGHPLTAVLEERPTLHAAELVIGNFSQLPFRSKNRARTGSERLFRRARPVRRSELLRVGYRQASAQHAGPPGDLQLVPRRPDNLCPAASVRRGVERLHAELRAQRCDGLLPDDRGQRRFLRRGNDLVYARPRLLPLASHTLVYEELVADPGRASSR